jgi:prepilin-type N-terminal cleavage/methylation domain-containing protein
MKKEKIQAFTLIELLMVIAIIGILAGILIPTVGAVRKQANVAASKAQLSNYVTAIQLFKGEYGFLPFVDSATTKSETFSLNSTGQSTEFIQTLSGREPDGSAIDTATARTTGNRKKIGFHSFSESEFFINDADVVSTNQIADRFNNIEISIELDADGDGFVDPDPTSQPIRTSVTAYVEADEDLGAPAYTLWD